VTSTDYRGCRA